MPVFHACISYDYSEACAIFIVVDRFSKMTHLLSCSKISTPSRLVRYTLTGRFSCMSCSKPLCQISVKFMNYFGKTLWHKTRTKLNFSTAFHPNADDQTKVANRSLEIFLQCLISKNLRIWALNLPAAEFTYNSSVNISTGMSPFEAVHDYKPRKFIDLLPITQHPRVSEPVSIFASHIHDLHK